MKTPTETTTGGEMVVLSDETGGYYLLPRDVVERGRVPEEGRAALERALAGEDVSGFSTVIEERVALLAASTTRPLGGLTVRGFVIYGQPPATTGGATTGIVVNW